MHESIAESLPRPVDDHGGLVASLQTERRSEMDIVREPVLADQQVSALAGLVAQRPAIVVLSPTIERMHGRLLRDVASQGQAAVHVISTGERNKSLDTVAGLLRFANDYQLSRDGVFIGIGGGVLLDIVGFAASQFRRGTAHVKIGTTLVAQVDAAVGIKCGVNVGPAKNLAGAFHPPERVVVDGQFLRTVSERDIRCGLAEMIKLALAVDAVSFAAIAQHGPTLLQPEQRDSAVARGLIDTSIRGMVAELAANPYELELRRRVDMGHTFSPVLEAATRYELRHGEAVAVDVALSAVLSARLGLLDRAALGQVLDLFRSLGIATWHPLMGDSDLITAALTSAEAHRGRKLRLPLPAALGETAFVDRDELPDSLIREAVSELRQESS